MKREVAHPHIFFGRVRDLHCPRFASDVRAVAQLASSVTFTMLGCRVGDFVQRREVSEK